MMYSQLLALLLMSGITSAAVPAITPAELPSDPPAITEPANIPGLETDFSAVAKLDNTASGWGPGTRMNKEGRPESPVAYQEKYGQYDADFIKANTEKVYLTIDEGYENGYTAEILDVLKDKNCPAVFFVTMPYVKQNPELVQRMIDEGHVVGSHSVTHPSAGMPSLSLEKQANEISELHQYVKEHFNYDMYLFRYPAGIFSEQSLALVQQLGYRSVFWSFAYRDWVTDDQPDPDQALATLAKRSHPGAIYLLHAVSKTNTQIMGQFIDDTRAAGYTFACYTQDAQ